MLGKSLKITSALLLLAVAVAAADHSLRNQDYHPYRFADQFGTAKTGDRFEANLASDLVVNGKTLAKTGAPVKGK